jgi:hypothetical protein
MSPVAYSFVAVVALAGFFAALALGRCQAPMIAVACPDPNVTTCSRIGIAVLTRPATSVNAELAGAGVRLKAGGLGGRAPTYWEGYVHIDPARLGLPVRVASGAVRLQLRPGWG